MNRKPLLSLFIVAVMGPLGATCCRAQARFSADTSLQNMGQIEWKHPTTARFVVSNTGDAPLVLTEVMPDCSCTVATWTDEPIAPGEQGEIRVEYDAETLGHFQKSVAVYTNAEPHVVRLGFSGEVVRQRNDYSTTHPYVIGDIRLDKRAIDFADSRMGESPIARIDVANGSDHAWEPVLMHLPAYVEMEARPEVLPKGGSGVITLTLHTDKLGETGLTQTSVYLSRHAGDVVGADNEIPLSAVVLPDFSTLTAAQRAAAPHISLSTTEANFQAANGTEQKHVDITISNTGRSTLHIDKVQTSTLAVAFKLKKTSLAPGETTRLRISRNKQATSHGDSPTRLLMISNDPEQPKVEIFIK